MSITVIVAAVIGLIIIVVVVALLTGKLGGFSKGVSGTTANHPELKFEGIACSCAS